MGNTNQAQPVNQSLISGKSANVTEVIQPQSVAKLSTLSEKHANDLHDERNSTTHLNKTARFFLISQTKGWIKSIKVTKRKRSIYKTKLTEQNRTAVFICQYN